MSLDHKNNWVSPAMRAAVCTACSIAAGLRWVRLKDVESVLGLKLDAQSTLCRAAAAAALRTVGGQVFMEAEALHAMLGSFRAEEAGRFGVWVERTVAYPARRQREQGASSS